MADSPRTRREPPRFRRVFVRGVEFLTPYMARVTFSGEELTGFTVGQPAASVRLLLSTPGEAALVMPTWDGNVFLLPDGERATIRTFTPQLSDSAAKELGLDVVIHAAGAASDWAQQAGQGDPAAISGPGRGYPIDPTATGFVLAGDETAIPAIGQLLEALPRDRPVQAMIEVRHPEARMSLSDHPLAIVDWVDLPTDAAPGDALLEAVAAAVIEPDNRVWAAGEAAAMQRIRRHLFEERDLPRAAATVRGYWKLRG
ncbi:MAG: siderophore-interacting protein [Acidimicrobiia bacterium]